MKETLLIVTDVFLVGGLETQIRDYSQSMMAKEVDVFLLTGPEFKPDLLPLGIKKVFNTLIVDNCFSYNDLEKNVENLVQIIKDYKITHLQVHPFVGIFSAYIAARISNISISAIFHGPISIHGFLPSYYDFYLKFLLLPNLDCVYAVSEETCQLIEHYCQKDRLYLLRNSVSVASESGKSNTNGNTWLICSRLDSAKIQGIKLFIDYALYDKQIERIDILGSGDALGELEKYILEKNIQTKVNFLGESSDSRSVMNMYDGVAGMGRVVLESISLGKPTVLIGYDGIKGVLTPENFYQLLTCNLSGRNVNNIEFEELSVQLKELSNEKRRQLIELLNDTCNVDTQTDRIIENFDKKNQFEFQDYLLTAYHSYKTLFKADLTESLLTSEVFFNYLGELLCSENNEQRIINAYSCFQKFSLEEKLLKLDVKINEFYEGLRSQVSTTSNEIKAAQLELSSDVNEIKAAQLELSSDVNEIKVAQLELSSDVNEIKAAQLELSSDVNEIKAAQLEQTSIAIRISDFFKSKKNQFQSINRRNLNMKIDTNFTYKVLRKIYRNLPSPIKNRVAKLKTYYIEKSREKTANRVEKLVDTDLSWEEFERDVLNGPLKYKGVFIQQEIIDWNVPLYQRPQHIATAFGKLGYLVIYKTHDLLGQDNVNGFREIQKNVWLTNKQEVNNIKNAVHSIYSTAYTNNFVELLNSSNITVYEYIDHIDEAISGDAENIKRLKSLKDLAFSGKSSFIVASAKNLYEEAVEAVGKEAVVFVQNGVDTEHYRKPEHLTKPVDDRLLQFRAKYQIIIGYFGAIAPWLWYELIEELAYKRPDLGFIYIGPDYYGGVERLVKSANVLYLGPVDYKILPSYAHQFDVCFIPFKPGDIAKSTSPLKLFEYFALEKPVVVTSDMRECVIYPEVFHGSNFIEINDALNKAIEIKDDAAYKKRLAQLADENSWLERAKAYEKVFE